MTVRVWSSEERRIALEQVSRMISERVEKARERRGEVSVETCENHQAMQVAIELQCRLTRLESIAGGALDRAEKYMDKASAQLESRSYPANEVSKAFTGMVQLWPR